MRQITTSICLGLGDNIVARIIFDMVKNQYDAIRISHDKHIMRIYKRNEGGYDIFLSQLGNLLFTEAPYYFDQAQYPAIHTLNTIRSVPPITRPNLQPLLCRGMSLNLGEEYIVITTKVRGLSRARHISLYPQLWEALRFLSNKYRIVIMGEREVQRNHEYRNLGTDIVYELYDDIIRNIPTHRIVDLTVPALGIMAPKLSKIQQDAFIMQQAKCVITLGLGGSVWLSAVAAERVIGYRAPDDNDYAADLIFNPSFTSAKVYKNWQEFITRLREV